MESIVKVEHLSHRYTVDWAIQDINFEVNRKGIRFIGIQWCRKIDYNEYYLRCIESDGWNCIYKRY